MQGRKFGVAARFSLVYTIQTAFGGASGILVGSRSQWSAKWHSVAPNSGLKEHSHLVREIVNDIRWPSFFGIEIDLSHAQRRRHGDAATRKGFGAERRRSPVIPTTSQSQLLSASVDARRDRFWATYVLQ